MKAYFDSDTWNKIGRPDLGSRIFIKRGKKLYFGEVHTIGFGTKKGIEIRIKVDKIKADEGRYNQRTSGHYRHQNERALGNP